MNLEQAKALDKKAWHKHAAKLKPETRNFIDGKFTPIPTDFDCWVRRSFAELSRDSMVEMIVTVLSEGIPSWRLQSEKIFSGDYRVPVRRK